MGGSTRNALLRACSDLSQVASEIEEAIAQAPPTGAAHVAIWRDDGRWIGWEVISRNGEAVRRIPKDEGAYNQTETYSAAQAMAADLNAGGTRRERRMRELEG